MRKLLYIALAALLAAPFVASAVTGEQVRFDWSNGQPAITADSTSECNDTAVARFDWSMGVPAIVFDSTANCTAAVAENPAAGPHVIVQGGRVILQGGKHVW